MCGLSHANDRILDGARAFEQQTTYQLETPKQQANARIRTALQNNLPSKELNKLMVKVSLTKGFAAQLRVRFQPKRLQVVDGALDRIRGAQASSCGDNKTLHVAGNLLSYRARPTPPPPQKKKESMLQPRGSATRSGPPQPTTEPPCSDPQYPSCSQPVRVSRKPPCWIGLWGPGPCLFNMGLP